MPSLLSNGGINFFEEVFPLQTICNYDQKSSSGNTENNGYLCILSINIMYRYIHCVLWFWLLFLCIISAIPIMKFLLLFFIENCWKKYNYINIILLLNTLEDNVNVNEEEKLSTGALFILDIIKKNVTSIQYHQILNV